MQAGYPKAWQGLINDFDLLKRNQAALVACRDAGAKTMKEQH
jgi:hypothetical protein